MSALLRTRWHRLLCWLDLHARSARRYRIYVEHFCPRCKRWVPDR